MFLFSIPFTGGHIGYERERVAQQGFILLFFDFFSYFQMSFLEEVVERDTKDCQRAII